MIKNVSMSLKTLRVASFTQRSFQQLNIRSTSSTSSTENLGIKYGVFRPKVEYALAKIESVPQKKYDPETSKRCGVIAKKKGMTCLWDETGAQLPCTVLQVEDCQVTYIKTPEKNGYYAVQLGAVDKAQHKETKAMIQHFANAGVEPKYHVTEFQVTEDAVIPVGTTMSAAHFIPGQFIDARAPCIGKGFQGGMKRHGFAGLRASHGVSLTHRSIGSTGQRAQPGKVFKGKKMPGRMGGQHVTTQNLKIIKIDTELNLIYVKGCVPGHDEQYVTLVDSVKKVGLLKFGLTKQQTYNPPADFNPPFPTFDPSLLSSVPRELVAKMYNKEPAAKKA